MDRAGLDAAMKVGVACGGWCPSGRCAEDEVISKRYPLRETPFSNYEQRTEWNVRDSDGTLILYQRPLVGGSLITKKYAGKLHKPVLLVELSASDTVSTILDWLQRNKIDVLNVAGPRESHHPGIYKNAYDVLIRVFSS